MAERTIISSNRDAAGAFGVAAAKTDSLPGLFGLRGMAAVMVLIFHLAPNVRVPPALSFVNDFFGLGVQLFFVLSGFSLMYSSWERAGKRDWTIEYLLKRFFRIAPAFYTMIAVFLVYNYAAWHQLPNWRVVLTNATFIFNLIPGLHESVVWAGWTVGVEMIFYALFPMVILAVRGITSAAILFCLSALVAHSVRVLMLNSGALPPGYEHTSFVVNIVYFSAGILAFHVFRAVRKDQRRAKQISLLFPVGIAFLLTFGLQKDAINLMLRSNLIALFWAVLFGSLALWQAIAPSRIFSTGILATCGVRSYSFYLTHAIIVFGLKRQYDFIFSALPHAGALAFALCVAIAFGAVLTVTELLYRLVEQPGIEYGRRCISTRRAARKDGDGDVAVPNAA